MRDNLAKAVFVTSGAFVIATGAFAYGMVAERYSIWPYQLVHDVHDAAKTLIRYGEIVPDGRLVPVPAYASREVFTVHDRARQMDGYYLFVGWDETISGYSAWLYDAEGEQQHRWHLNYDILDPDGPLNGSDSPHGFAILPNGAVIVNFDNGDVLGSLDLCSKPVWTRQGVYHHSIELAEDGSAWSWRGDGTAYGHYHYMVKFDPYTGELIDEIDLIEDVLKPLGERSIVFSVRPDFPFRSFEADPVPQSSADFFHPNDIDILSSEYAHEFPQFAAGDLLISLRNNSLVAVVDPSTRELKWWSHGPWIGQHDPDFTAWGTISVYNNNTGRGRSEIVQIDPENGEISNPLGNGDLQFYSQAMGKHQYLPNGNVLIVVPGEGRIVEATAHGEVVMEFNNVSSVSRGMNEHVENAAWLPADFFTTDPVCAP